jgi:hypothetical protein
MVHSEGEETSLKILAVCQSLLTLAESEKIGNTSDGDTLVSRSPPGIACESVLPTPAVMRTHRTRWAGRRGKARRPAGKREDLDVLPAPVSHPGAAKCSPSHIQPPHRSEQDRLVLNKHGRRWRQETTDRAHATGSIPFGS